MSRNVLVVSSAESGLQIERTLEACSNLEALGLNCLFATEDFDRLGISASSNSESKKFLDQALEIVLVLGGDGSILRAAELSRAQEAPLIGVNLGHIGFMSEAELNELEVVIAAIDKKAYTSAWGWSRFVFFDLRSQSVPPKTGPDGHRTL